MNMGSTAKKSPLLFCLLLLIVSIPFWLLDQLLERFLPPKKPVNLPLSSLMAFNPALVALYLVYREKGRAGVREFWQRSFQGNKYQNRLWYLPAFLLMPGLMLLTYRLMRWPGKTGQGSKVPLGRLPLMFLVFLVAAIGEELGWQGYLAESLQEKRGTRQTGLLIGTVWAAWHIIPFRQANHNARWIFWQCNFSVSFRLLLVWLYLYSGNSVMAASLMHATYNVSAFSFPGDGAGYDPFYSWLVTTGAAALVITLWNPETSAGKNNEAGHS